MRRTPLKRKSRTPLAKAKEELWELCKQITRTRYGNSCYSCPAKDLSGGNWHTGHFIPKATCSAELAYSLDNLRPQCRFCNFFKNGNWPEFERHLREEKGLDFPELLKQRNRDTTGKKYDILWYQARIAEYTDIAASLSGSGTAPGQGKSSA